MHINILAVFGIVVFILGLFFVASHGGMEGFDTGVVPPSSCPDMLVKKDGKIYLYNNRKQAVPGVNPIVFNTLEDYSEFVDWQHSQGIHCPILQLEKTYDPQGQEVYKMQSDILNPQGGIPPMKMYGLDQPNVTLLTDAGRNDPSYNENSYPAFDAHGQDIGAYTPQDAQDTAVQNNPLYPSPNPMDINWGGSDYSQKLIDMGYYKGNEVTLYTP